MLSLQCAITRDLIDNSDPGYTRLNWRKITSVCPSKNTDKKKKKEKDKCKEFCVTRKLKQKYDSKAFCVTRKSKNWNDKLFSLQENAKKLSQS